MDRLEIIETLKHFPDRLEAELGGLPAEVLSFRPAEGEWSIREVIGHAVYAEEIWYRRLYSVWSMHDPVLMRFDMTAQESLQETVANAPDLSVYLNDLRLKRPRIVDLLSHAVDWTRLGQWPGVGRRSLKQLAESLVEHDAETLGQVRGNIAAARALASR